MAATGGNKRSRPESDAPSLHADVELKRRRLDGGESDAQQIPESRLDAISASATAIDISALSAFSDPKPDPSEENGPPGQKDGRSVQTEASAPAPAPAPASPTPAAAVQPSNGTSEAAAPRVRVQICIPFARSAIKLTALKGMKKDLAGDQAAPAAKKATPTKPRIAPKPAAKLNRRTKVAPAAARSLENSADVPQQLDAAAITTNGTHHPVSPQPPQLAAKDASISGIMDTPSKNRFFAPLAAAAPKGILTPTKKRGPRPSKSVTFDGNGPPPLDFLSRSTSAKKPGRPKKLADPDEIVCGICAKPHSKPPNEIILCDHCDFPVHQKCYDVPEIPEGDWLCKSCMQQDIVVQTTQARPPVLPLAPVPPAEEVPTIANLDHHLGAMQRVLLDRCAGRRPIRLFGQDEAGEKVQQLLEQTVLAGEGNSMLLIGPRGSGKTTLVDKTILDLSHQHGHEFHLVRLNGFIHTDDKLALREIWRQLGKEMKVDDDVLNRSNYADTMASLLALLSHPSEILGRDDGVTSQAVVFVIDEFDMFATHPRQTLLYNLFDIAQSRKAPIAVLGCTTRLDVVEMLEKRVKSRFSHRYVYLSLAKSLPAYWQVCRQGLMLGDTDASKEGINVRLEGYAEFQKYWNSKIEDLYKHRQFQDLLQYHYYTTKSVAAFLSEWILPLSRLSPRDLTLRVPVAGGWSELPSSWSSLAAPDSRMQLLESLSDLDLSLLIAAARLDVVAHTDTINFAMAYDEYSSLVGRQRVQSASSGLLALGGNVRVWGRGVASTAWERLVALGLIVPSGIGGGARSLAGGGGGLDGRMWKVDVSLEEIPCGVGLSSIMARWCREI